MNRLFGFYSHSDSSSNVVYQKYKSNVINTTDVYERKFNNIDGIKLSENNWGAQINMFLKIHNKNSIFGDKYKFIKCNIDCIYNNNWSIEVKLSRESSIAFIITNNGQLQYSSENDFEVKYIVTYF